MEPSGSIGAHSADTQDYTAEELHVRRRAEKRFIRPKATYGYLRQAREGGLAGGNIVSPRD